MSTCTQNMRIKALKHDQTNALFRKTSNSSPFCACLVFMSCDKVYQQHKVRLLLYLFCHSTTITLIHWIKKWTMRLCTRSTVAEKFIVN